ncbi:MAG TPA: hypothetical protein VD761_10220 [Solirubrobacterales bacterium]|nr:hypothetical protein [Solirubrobacterales bacterium]
MGGPRATVLGALCLLVLAFSPATAEAVSPLKIREVYPGSTAAPLAEYVELQMTADGQNTVQGQLLRFYNASGTEVPNSSVLLSNVVNGGSQRTILLATAEASAVGADPDFSLTSIDRMSPAGGAVCFTGAGPTADDCLTWGSIPIFGSSSTFPDRQVANASPGGITNTKALVRTISRGCPSYLDGLDDSDNSAADFAELSPPDPDNNDATPTEQRCAPDTAITIFPPAQTNQASASFQYAESPSEDGAGFGCALDWVGVLEVSDFSTCSENGIVYGSLAEGQHRFAVRAVGEGGPDLSPATYSWVIDTTAPQTTIDSVPPAPSNGFAATFAYHSSEGQSSFRCQLDGGEIQVCASSGRTYFSLPDGAHTFRVWAVDNAGNQDPSAAEHHFNVQNVLRDQTPPDTAVLSGPSNPSNRSSASFTYSSSEPGSSFQCRVGDRAFAACAASGTTFSDLKNGRYLFEVRAIDRAGNVDSVPASYAWTVAAPGPDSRFTKAPPGRVRAKGSKRVRALFAFTATDPKATFRCRLDLKGKFRPCRSPKLIRVEPGRHVFEVYAVDRLGNVEPTPTRRIFRVEGNRKGGLFS